MMIDWLIESGVAVTQARLFAEPLKASMALFDISTPERKSIFLGQAMVESTGLTALEEGLSYRDPVRIATIFKTGFDLNRNTVVDPHEVEFAKGFVRKPKELANRAYANRNGNGDEASGDGWRYRGRGLFQLTGRENYVKASVGVGLGAVYVHNPDLVAQPSDACLTAAWFWTSKGCNQLADMGNVDACTRLINGKAMLHAKERRAASDKALWAYKEVFG